MTRTKILHLNNDCSNHLHFGESKRHLDANGNPPTSSGQQIFHLLQSEATLKQYIQNSRISHINMHCRPFKLLFLLSICLASKTCLSLQPSRIDRVLSRALPAIRIQLVRSPWTSLDLLGCSVAFGFIMIAIEVRDQKLMLYARNPYI